MTSHSSEQPASASLRPSPLASRLGRWRGSVHGFSWALMWTLIVGLVALGSRLWGIGDRSLWLDEATSWQAARLSLPAMVEWTANDVHPPLYYALLHFWMNVLGGSEAALRSMSAVAGGVTILLLGAVAWRAGGRVLGIMAATLLALNSTHLEFSQEARMYSLVGLLSVAATIALASFLARSSWLRLGAYVVLTTSLLYAHYIGFIVLAVHGLLFAGYGLERLWRYRSLLLLGWATLAFALIAFAYSPWLSNLREDLQAGVGHIPEPSWGHVSTVLRALLALDNAGDAWLFMAVPFLGLGLLGVWRRRSSPLVVCIGALALVPVGQVVISVLLTPVLALRQTSPFIPGLAFLLAIGVVEAGRLSGSLRGPARAGAFATFSAIGVALLAVMLAGVFGLHKSVPREDWRQVATDLQGVPGRVLLWKHYLLAPMEYYLDDEGRLLPLTWQTMRSVQDGFVPIARGEPGEEGALVLAHHQLQGEEQAQALLQTLEPYFTVSGPIAYRGQIYSYRLQPISTAEYNVNIFSTYKAQERWRVTPEGHLRTDHQRSYFEVRSPLDRDDDGRVDRAFAIHIDYWDAGPSSFSVAGFPQEAQTDTPTWLMTIPIEGTGTWRSAEVLVQEGSLLSRTFFLTSEVTIRTLEVRRYELDGAAIHRFNTDSLRDWFLRPDGYLETVGPASCIWPVPQANAPVGNLVSYLTYADEGQWRDMALEIPGGAERVCPEDLPENLVVRRLVVAPVSTVGDVSPDA